MKKKVLIVDDQEINVSILKEILEDHYLIASVSDGEQCIGRVKDFTPDVVLLDVMMPGMDGYETCRVIKAENSSNAPQIILISAKSSVESRLKGYEAGADDYIAKPFDADELLAKVNVHIRLKDALTNLESMYSQLSIQNTRLEELVQDRTIEIVETRDLAVFALAKLAESRDPETGEHLERIQKYSFILAGQLAYQQKFTNEINKFFIENIYRSSPLHDIGKVGIPDAILLKPGQLTTSEFEILKEHTTIGSNAIIRAVKHGSSGGFLEMGADIARSHHERFDGTGYPDGLAGSDIPLAARIVALADVFDALTSVRVYKSALEPEVAKTMILKESGTHFDPVVVDAFSTSWKEFLNVRALIDNSKPQLVEAEASSDVRR